MQKVTFSEYPSTLSELDVHEILEVSGGGARQKALKHLFDFIVKQLGIGYAIDWCMSNCFSPTPDNDSDNPSE